MKNMNKVQFNNFGASVASKFAERIIKSTECMDNNSARLFYEPALPKELLEKRLNK